MNNLDLQTIIINKATVDLWDRGVLEIEGDTIILTPIGAQASIEGWTPEQLKALPIVHAGFRCVVCFAYCDEITLAQDWELETYLNDIYIGAVCPRDQATIRSLMLHERAS